MSDQCPTKTIAVEVQSNGATTIFPPVVEVQFEMSREDVFDHCLLGHARHDSPGVVGLGSNNDNDNDDDDKGSWGIPGASSTAPRQHNPAMCPCGEDHSSAAWDFTGLAGSGSGSRAPDISSHEVYCGCSDCHAEEDDEFDFDDDDFCDCEEQPCDCYVDLVLEQFTFTITPDLLPEGDYQDCWNPDTLMAFWDDGELLVGDTQSDARWRVINCEEQRRPGIYYTWYCERIGVLNPCTEDFMKAISS